MAEKGAEDKIFAAFIAVMCVVFGAIILATSVMIIIGIWQAGFINFVVWSLIFTVIFFISRVVYRLIIRNNWL